MQNKLRREKGKYRQNSCETNHIQNRRKWDKRKACHNHTNGQMAYCENLIFTFKPNHIQIPMPLSPHFAIWGWGEDKPFGISTTKEGSFHLTTSHLKEAASRKGGRRNRISTAPNCRQKRGGISQRRGQKQKARGRGWGAAAAGSISNSKNYRAPV